MNICITNKCNNDCVFCFQDRYKSDEKNEMTIEDVIQILNWFRRPEKKISIMGGEPTLHPQVLDICQYLSNIGYKTTILTNLLCDKNLVKELLNILNLNILINTIHNDCFEEMFLENYKIVLSRNLDTLVSYSSAITLAITINSDDDFNKKNLERLKMLLEMDANKVVMGVRISHDMPHNDDKYVLNKNYGKYLKEVIESTSLINPQLQYAFDCSLNLCLIDEEMVDFIKQSEKIHYFALACENANIDIKPNFSTSWCPCFDTHDTMSVKNIFDFSCYDDMNQYLVQKRNVYMKTNPLHCDYKNCGKTHICRGVCEGINRYL